MSFKLIPESKELESGRAGDGDPTAAISTHPVSSHGVSSAAESSPASSASPAAMRLFGKPGPFQIIAVRPDMLGAANRVGTEQPGQAPRRRYSCAHYEKCLDLAAALDWDNFTCRGCSGEIDESLLWRAHQMNRRDAMVKAICELPTIQPVDQESAGRQPAMQVTHRNESSSDDVIGTMDAAKGPGEVKIVAHGRGSS